MRLGFDLDEVIVDLTSEPLETINKEFNLDFTIEVQKTYFFSDNVYTGDAELDKEIATRFLELIKDEELTKRAPAIEKAPYYLRQFKKQGHSVHLITHRPTRLKDLTIKWLRKNKIPFDNFIILGMEGQKGPYGRVLNLDMYVDDLMSNLEDMHKYKNRWRKGLLLLDRPWNHDYIDTSIATRVNNWKEINLHLGIGNK